MRNAAIAAGKPEGSREGEGNAMPGILPQKRQARRLSKEGPGNLRWNRVSLMDIAMMRLTGGMARTAKEFRALLTRAKLKFTRVVPTSGPLSIVEAVRV